jgi:uncharacterized protein YbjT (DUF2867 family)
MFRFQKEASMATRSETVLVFGATGQQGGSTAQALVDDGWRVRALVRDGASARAKKLEAQGVELVRGDLRDRDSLARALAGAYGVFSVQPSSGQPEHGVTDEDERTFGVSIADLALSAGVRHFVYSSVGALTGGTGVGHFESKWQVEEHVRASDLAATIVRPGSFMELLCLPWFGLAQGSFLFFTRPDQRMQFVAVQDIGKLVARVFAAPNRYIGRTIELAGDSLTGTELADKIGGALGKTLRYARFPPEVLAQNAMLKNLVALLDRMDEVGRADIPALRREVPGLLTFDDWLARGGADALRAATTGSSPS